MTFTPKTRKSQLGCGGENPALNKSDQILDFEIPQGGLNVR